MSNSPLPHAVSRLRSARLARSSKPFLARGGPKGERCAGCRLVPSHCLCALRPQVSTQVGMCLLMADIEPLKPSNTGWLVADLVAATFAFGWARTTVEPALLTLLHDPQWQPYLVFPGEFVDPQRVVHTVTPPENASNASNASEPTDPLAPTQTPHPRPLFILLDGTWDEARKMFRKSPYLNHLPVLSLQPEQTSRYRLRRAQRSNHLCTAEVAAVCLYLANAPEAAQALNAYLDLYIQRYTMAKHQQAVARVDAVQTSGVETNRI